MCATYLRCAAVKRAGIFLFLLSLREGYSRWSPDCGAWFVEHVGCCWRQLFISRRDAQCGISLDISERSLPVCLSVCLSHHSACRPPTLGVSFITCPFFSICLCHWRLYHSSALHEVFIAPCCDRKYLAIITWYLGPGNRLFMCASSLFSHYLVVSKSDIALQSFLLLLCTWQGCRLTCACSNINELSLWSGVASLERRVGVSERTKT